jgi:glucose/arabinose dehydrogenase
MFAIEQTLLSAVTDSHDQGRPHGGLEERGGGEARGRPVGVAFDNQGALLVADDVGNRIWRVSPKSD